MNPLRIVVAGGGAAGFFGAVSCAESQPDADVSLLEKSPALLAKVAISGGGRCNVTHACFDPDRLVEYYPRGGRELLGPFHRWQPKDTVDWFESRGVKLKTESDGRMFPVTDQSSSITDCLIREAKRLGINTHVRKGLAGVERGKDKTGFSVRMTNGKSLECDRLLIATGGNLASHGYEVAASLGHTIVPLVPSLFTFNIEDPRLRGLAGLSVPDAQVTAPSQRLVQKGPVLVTHWGLSGPAILKLSAWGARSFADGQYEFDLCVNWTPFTSEDVHTKLETYKRAHPARKVLKTGLLDIPSRLWDALARHAGIMEDLAWGRLSKDMMKRLAGELASSEFAVRGKSLFKEEFVTCGGVSLKEINFKTMESKLCKGLYFAGEILDIDGLTGGFNLQSAWTTGRIAGMSMGQP